MVKKIEVSTLSAAEKAQMIAGWLDEKKAFDIVALDITSYHSIMEGICIATATSTRHAQGLCEFVMEQCKGQGFEYLRNEGYTNGSWILIDLNDVVVHVFIEESRNLFRLQDLWSEGQVVATFATGGA